MKKIYMTFLALSSILSANAQLTQSNHAPISGDAYSTYQCDSTLINPGASGAGATWNFAVATRSSVIKNYMASTSSNPQYPSATVGVATSSSNTSYFSSSSSSLLYYGGNISVGPVLAQLNYTTPAVAMVYPMALNTVSTSAIGGSINVTAPIAANGSFTGNSSVKGDGSGTLTVASHTFTNVMKVVSSQTINFVTNFASGSVLQTTYDYYDSGFKYPVFSIATATANTPLGVSTQTLVSRLNFPAPTGLTQNTANDNSVRIYPNPAFEEMNFITSNSATELVIYDLTGKLIDSRKFENGNLKLNVSSFDKGLYIYRITDNKNKTINTGKITVID